MTTAPLTSSATWRARLLDAWSDATPMATLCAVYLLAVFAIGLLAPLISPYDEAAILTNESFGGPSAEMWLGSDYLGRDVLSRMIYGVRITLFLALAITALSFFVGTTLGFLAAAFGGRFDMIVSRVNDAFLSFPALMLALIVINSLGSSIPVLILTIAFIDMTRVFRVARALAADIVVLDYVEAAHVRGEGKGWIIWREVLPNALTPLAAEFGIRFTYAILFISALSFLGLGVQPPQSDLGVMVKENMQSLLYGAYTAIAPALCIAGITVSVNILVDWFLQRTSAKLPDEI